jgi:hypothetical protein
MNENLAFACVYIQSPEFPTDYLYLFSNAIETHHPGAKKICFTDYQGPNFPKDLEKIPLKYQSILKGKSGKKYHPWFAKLELFSPDVSYDIVYTDLDNLILKPFDPLLNKVSEDKVALIEDLDPKKKRLQSALMWIPHKKKSVLWDHFMKNDPAQRVLKAGIFGDADIIRQYYTRENSDIIQEIVHQDFVVSFSFHWKNMKNKNNTSVLCFHGKKRKPLLVQNNNPEVKKYIRKHLSSSK